MFTEYPARGSGKTQLSVPSGITNGLEAQEGAVMWAVSALGGKKLSEYKLDSLPVWDGMIASGGNLYMTTMNGEVLCYSGKNS